MVDANDNRFPPPLDSRPEAVNFQHPVYTMSQDRDFFVAPPQGPPPKDLWYKIPDQARGEPLKPIFPWEATAPAPTRVFPEDIPPPTEDELVASVPSTADSDTVIDKGTDL